MWQYGGRVSVTNIVVSTEEMAMCLHPDDDFTIPAETIEVAWAALPTLVPRINSSDHWSFWKQGWPALMVTDTAPYRDAAYHTPQDTPERLNYERMARVVEGLGEVVRSLAGEAQPPAIDRMVAR